VPLEDRAFDDGISHRGHLDFNGVGLQGHSGL
jgi:hypothetical protein